MTDKAYGQAHADAARTSFGLAKRLTLESAIARCGRAGTSKCAPIYRYA